METKQDFWFWLAVVASVAALFLWALADTLKIGGPWVLLSAIVVVALALGSVAVREGLRNKCVIWTEEMKIAQKHRARQLVRESILSSIFGVCMLSLMGLVRANILPQWAGAVLFLMLLVGWRWAKSIVCAGTAK